MSIALDGLIFVTGWAHVILAPYTKVEESFNLHATHDILGFGIATNILPYNRFYDHFTFSGAVPRTFVGAVLLSWLSQPIIELASWKGLISQKFDLQILVRLVLATSNAFGLCLIRRAVSRRFGRLAGLFFTLLTITQFHLPFWMGRTLPNMFALLPVNIAIYLLVDRAPNKTKPSQRSLTAAISLLTFTAVVLRAEVLLLLAPIVLQSLLHRNITLIKVIKVGLVSGLLSLALTVIVDSFFWNQPYIWPEFAGIYFNVLQGKSSEWGTSPLSTYWTNYLPKLLLAAFPLSIIGLFCDQRIRDLLFPFFVFLGLISGLQHKEWRFIIYVVPAFNIAAARGARWMVSLPKNTLRGRLSFLSVPALLGLNIAVTTILTLTSMNNYPGGQALALLHQLYPTYNPPVHVHISNLAAQTGASLFLHFNEGPRLPGTHVLSSKECHRGCKGACWVYNKTESLATEDLTANTFVTHLITETKPDALAARHWKTVASVKSFERWEIGCISKIKLNELTMKRLGGLMKMHKEEKLWILERIEMPQLGPWPDQCAEPDHDSDSGSEL
ncbi:glycosyltransferase family 22 protein [Lyophyllum atratum]|nr:glycosyltransferase family 22 protein [Lyophyllum atratum]